MLQRSLTRAREVQALAVTAALPALTALATALAALTALALLILLLLAALLAALLTALLAALVALAALALLILLILLILLALLALAALLARLVTLVLLLLVFTRLLAHASSRVDDEDGPKTGPQLSEGQKMYLYFLLLSHTLKCCIAATTNAVAHPKIMRPFAASNTARSRHSRGGMMSP